MGADILDRMVRAVEKVRDRMRRAVAALETAGIPYAVVGGNAVAAHVARVDEAAVRNTPDIDLLLRRSDWVAAIVALSDVGIALIPEGAEAKSRDAVHAVFADDSSSSVTDSEAMSGGRILALDALVRMKLTSFRRKDQVHIQDLIAVGLVDASWLGRVPATLAPRLKEILDDPEG